MNKAHAKIIAKTITNEQILEMFNNAQESITNWKEVSVVNFGITKGTAWNILAYNFDVEINYHVLAKQNMIYEFGDYLPDELKIVKVRKLSDSFLAYHQAPKFK